jgi:hypothetical protein
VPHGSVADHQSGEHQAGVTVQWFPTEYSINRIRRTAAKTAVGTFETCAEDMSRSAYGARAVLSRISLEDRV